MCSSLVPGFKVTGPSLRCAVFLVKVIKVTCWASDVSNPLNVFVSRYSCMGYHQILLRHLPSIITRTFDLESCWLIETSPEGHSSILGSCSCAVPLRQHLVLLAEKKVLLLHQGSWLAKLGSTSYLCSSCSLVIYLWLVMQSYGKIIGKYVADSNLRAADGTASFRARKLSFEYTSMCWHQNTI